MTATFCRITSCERWEVSIDFNARCAGFNLISGTLVGLELEEEEEMVEEVCPKDLGSDLPSFLYIVAVVIASEFQLWYLTFEIVCVEMPLVAAVQAPRDGLQVRVVLAVVKGFC